MNKSVNWKILWHFRANEMLRWQWKNKVGLVSQSTTGMSYAQNQFQHQNLG